MKYIAEALIIIGILTFIFFVSWKVSPFFILLFFCLRINTNHWFKNNRKKGNFSKRSKNIYKDTSIEGKI